jgi:hypothetical protein
MSIVRLERLRFTAVGVLARYHRGRIQFGTHISRASFDAHPNTTQRSTVQGEIARFETKEQAMQRWVEIEYGREFAKQCDISALNDEPILSVGSSGVPKLYYWHWIWAQPYAEPSINPRKVHQYFWDEARHLDLIVVLMSFQKAGMFKRITDLEAMA